MTYKEFARRMAAWEQFGDEAQAKVLGATYLKLYKLWLDRVGHYTVGCVDCGSVDGTFGCIQCFDNGRVGTSLADRIGFGAA